MTPVQNIVLVHGAFVDGSGWRGVYDRLTADGFQVAVVQNPTSSLAADVAAVNRCSTGSTARRSSSATPTAAW